MHKRARNRQNIATHLAQYSTVQHSTVQYSTVQYSTVQYSTVQHALETAYLALQELNQGWG